MKEKNDLYYEELEWVKMNLVDNGHMYSCIRNEIHKVILNLFHMLENQEFDLRKTLLSNNKSEMGQVGEKSTLIEDIQVNLKDVNVREVMAILQNFIKDVNKTETCRVFIDTIIKTRKKTDHDMHAIHYDFIDPEWIGVMYDFLTKLVGWPFEIWYEEMEKDAKHKVGFPNACSLWNPIVFMYPSHAITNPHVKWDGNLQENVRAYTYAPPKQRCDFKQSELAEFLSKREKSFLGEDIDNLPWISGHCVCNPIKESKTLNLMMLYGKNSICNVSGHTYLFITLCKYFKNVDMVMVVLACMIFMTPHDHSVHEIIMAAKNADIHEFQSYNPIDNKPTKYMMEIIKKYNMQHGKGYKTLFTSQILILIVATLITSLSRC